MASISGRQKNSVCGCQAFPSCLPVIWMPRRFRLHDVLRNYLQQKTAAHVARFHQTFLNAYRLTTWGDLSLKEPYLWKYLFFHLKATGRMEEFLTTVQDFRYLAKKAFLLGSHIIETDLQEATTLVPHDQSLALLHSRIAQIGHLLNRSKTWLNMQCLFLSYVCDGEHYREQRAALEKHVDGVYVKACYNLAALLPSMLYRTLHGHTDEVRGCAISADGQWVISASDDKTLKIWNRETGGIVHTLEGHTREVNGCTISADGRWVVSASDDKTLKIWNRETGEMVHTLQGHTDQVRGCAISADGKFIVSALGDMTVKIWNRETGKVGAHSAWAYGRGQWMCDKCGWEVYCLCLMGWDAQDLEPRDRRDRAHPAGGY